MAGVQNIVAPQGTAFTDQHARIFKRYVDEVVLCFDSDEAGQNAAVRSLDHLLASGLAVRVAVVPAPHDPDSFIKANGGEAFRKLVEGAEGFFDYYLNRLCQQNDAASDKGRLAILRAMAEAVHKTGNVVLVDTYAQKTALRLGVSPEAVRAEFKKIPQCEIRTGGRRRRIIRIRRSRIRNAASLEPRISSAQTFVAARQSGRRGRRCIWTQTGFRIRSRGKSSSNGWRRRQMKAGKASPHFWTNAIRRKCEVSSPKPSREDREIPNPEQQLADVALKLRNQFLDRQITALDSKHQTSQTRTKLMRRRKDRSCLR